MTSRVVSIEDLLRHAGWLRRLAASLLHDRDAGEDVAQETLVAAWKRPPAAGRNPRPWLATVATNVARDSARADARRAARELTAHVAAGAEVSTPEQLVGAAETYRMVAEVVSGLEEPLRQTLVLRYYDGLSSAAIARHHGLPEGTVRARLKRGLDRVRADLDARHSGERRKWVRVLLPLVPPSSAGPALLLKGRVAAVGAGLVSLMAVVAVVDHSRPHEAVPPRSHSARPVGSGGGERAREPGHPGPVPPLAAAVVPADGPDPALLACHARLRLAHQELVTLETDLVQWDAGFLFTLGEPNPAAEQALAPLAIPLLNGPRQHVVEHRFRCQTWACRLAVRLRSSDSNSASWRSWRTKHRLELDAGIKARVSTIQGGLQAWEGDLLEGDGLFVYVMHLRLRQPSGSPLPGATLAPPPRKLVLPATVLPCEASAADFERQLPARRTRWKRAEPLDRQFERSLARRAPDLEQMLQDRQPWYTNLLANTECRGRVCRQRNRYPLLGRKLWEKSAGPGRRETVDRGSESVVYEEFDRDP